MQSYGNIYAQSDVRTVSEVSEAKTENPAMSSGPLSHMNISKLFIKKGMIKEVSKLFLLVFSRKWWI